MATEELSTEVRGRGRPGLVLPNGERRIDYMRRRVIDEGATRGEVVEEVNDMYEEAGLDDFITYQIVFSATKGHEATPATRGRRPVELPDGRRRRDYIRQRYYEDGISRSDIVKEVNELYQEAHVGIRINYQIVYLCTPKKENSDG